MAHSVSSFIQRWQGVQQTAATELSSSQTFILELCALLGVPTPLPTEAQDYMFERPISFAHGDGSSSAGRIDCYKRGHFVWESKKLRLSPKGEKANQRFDTALLAARSQAENYARALPPCEIAQGRPPFLLVADVGNVLEIYADFTRSGATYTPFPDPRHHRIKLTDLADEAIRERLRQIWLDPVALDPSRASARVTREVSQQLAELAKSLEQSGHRADHVAAFLTRCLFSMFAEDVELLPKGSFVSLIEQHGAQPATLQMMLQALWASMDSGGFSAALATQVLKFNGKLFKYPASDGYSLLLNPEQIKRLALAAKANWREVEPAIFGTLLERALHVDERHALGAHYTPRAYVERLVLPTVIEPLRQQWSIAQASALVLASEAAELSGKAHDAKLSEARAEIKKFLHELCTLRVLDPACGSGNFLYVTLEHLKRLEGEVINQLEALGETQSTLGMEGETVSPRQLLGIELNERAAALAELVLWIGYLQWHIRTRGNKAVAEPVVHDFGNIECRDAVLAWDDMDLAKDSEGNFLTRWDGKTFKTHPSTGEPVPDETAVLPQWQYIRARKAKWPKSDYIVGNPPFIGKLRMREALGDGYVEALRSVWLDVPDSADFVMYWWNRAAQLTLDGKAHRFGLITTNSLTQSYNGRVVQQAIEKGISLDFAIPDHPWVDNVNGAAVRIAMTVGAKSANEGHLLEVTSETSGEYGEVSVTTAGRVGQIHANLTIGANLAEAVALKANERLSTTGVIPHGEGMLVTSEQAAKFEPGAPVKAYRNGKDLAATPRNLMVIDCYGLSSEEVRNNYPTLYQWLLDRVKPERDANRDKDLREKWWLHRRNNEDMRRSLQGLPRYIATVMTAKHRIFQFLEGNILPDQKLVVIGLADSCNLGVLSSSAHVSLSQAMGGWLGVGNDPVYVKSRCFETFPFPDDDTGLTPALREKIASLAEQIDAHRKRQQAAHPALTLTGMYNVLTALKEGRALSAKEQTIHTQGLVAVLKSLHDELDSAVLAAYGLPEQISTDALLESLVQLNARRAREEASGQIRWLRPSFQDPAQRNSAGNDTLSNNEHSAQQIRRRQADLALETEEKIVSKPAKASTITQQPWPADLPAQILAVASVLASAPQALSLPEIEAHFKGRGAWKASLPRILDTLEALGKAQQTESRQWRVG
ncbi:MAG: class I SAM-dependent DNA methyltransferase [Burkholderiales bacterium]|nr:MAG: class I SAM-dependent DNA methyltransferase [Burkholderiales bacterium]